MIKKSHRKSKEEGVYQTLTMGSVIIFPSLFTEELLQTKHFLLFLYIYC